MKTIQQLIFFEFLKTVKKHIFARFFEKRFVYLFFPFFSTDESTSYNLLTSHSNYQQPLQSSMHGSNLITSSLSMPHDISSNIYPPSTSIVQSQSSQPIEQIPYSDEFSAPLVEHEQYIYVQTYQHQSGDLKKRLSDRYELKIV